MMDIQSDTNELFFLLKKRPEMLMKGDVNSLLSYIIFFEGFFLSIKLFQRIDIEREISRWYQYQVETKAPNMYWFSQFEMENKGIVEKEKIKLFLNLLSDFFDENISLFSQNKN